MADVSPADTTMAGLLNAIFTSLSAVIDYRGTALPAAQTWTWARFQNAGTTEAVYASAAPAGTPMTKTPQLILCGTTAGPTITVAAPDASGTANVMYASINKNGGAYNAYTAALPFTSGQFFGFWKAATTAALSASTVVRSFISQETVFIQIIYPTTTQQCWIYFGAIGEPYSNDTTNDGETDNRLYGIQCGGTLNNTNALTNTSATMFLHSGSASAIHSGVFTPGAGTLIVGGSRSVLINAPLAAALQTASGVYVGDIFDFAVGSTADGNRTATVRGMYRAGLVQSGRYLRNGGTDLYHFVAMSNIAAAQGIMLPAVA